MNRNRLTLEQPASQRSEVSQRTRANSQSLVWCSFAISKPDGMYPRSARDCQRIFEPSYGRRVLDRPRSVGQVGKPVLRNAGCGTLMETSRRVPRMRLLSLSALFLALPSLAADPPKGIDFAHDVVPILKTRCAKCHTNGTYKGSVSFDTRADVLKKAAVSGRAAESELFRRISSNDPDTRMPPKSEALSAKEVKVLE